MKAFVTCVSAFALAACGSSSASNNNSAIAIGNSTATAGAPSIKPQECAGNNSMSTGDVGNYGMLVAYAIQAQHPDIPEIGPLVRHVRDNQDMHVRFIQEGGSCVIWYQGNTEFEGSSYHFEGKCKAAQDGQSPDGSNDWKPTSCTAEQL